MALVRADLQKPLVVNAKMVSYLMSQNAMYSRVQLIWIMASHQDRHAVDADLVRKHQVVTVAPLCQRHAVVETQELRSVLHSGTPQRLRIWPVFHNDLDVVHPAPDGRRDGVKGLCYQFFKSRTVHARRYDSIE
jgi:hypothetical protein